MRVRLRVCVVCRHVPRLFQLSPLSRKLSGSFWHLAGSGGAVGAAVGLRQRLPLGTGLDRSRTHRGGLICVQTLVFT